MFKFCLVGSPGPIWQTYVSESPFVSGNMWYALWLCIATLVVGLALGTLVIIFADTGLSSAGRMIRCSLGFLVAIVWIMAIADEVVNVLQVGSYFILTTFVLLNLSQPRHSVSFLDSRMPLSVLLSSLLETP